MHATTVLRPLCLLLVGTLYAFVFTALHRHSSSLTLWYRLSPDYSTLAASHALYFESRLRGFGEATFFQSIHPGIPFQLTSWLLATALLQDAPSEYSAWIASLFERLATYQTLLRYTAFILQLLALTLGTWMARTAAVPHVLLVLFIPFSYSYSLRFGTEHLGNESFAWISILLLAEAWRRLIRRPSERNVILTGLLCAWCYSIKLNYIVLFFVSLLLSAICFHPAGLKAQLRAVLVLSFAMLSSTLALCLSVLGQAGLLEMLNRHWKVFQHTGHYGGGGIGVLNLGNMKIALDAMLIAAPWYFILLSLSVFFALLQWYRVERDPTAEGASKRQALRAVIAALAITAFLLAALKHYQAHYLVPTAPLLFVLLLDTLPKANRRMFFVAAVVLGIAVTESFATLRTHLRLVEQENAAVSTELAAVEQLARETEGPLVWTYQSKSRVAVLGQILLQANQLALLPATAGKSSAVFFDLWSKKAIGLDGSLPLQTSSICDADEENRTAAQVAEQVSRLCWSYLIRLNREPHRSHTAFSCLGEAFSAGTTLEIFKNTSCSLKMQ